MNIRGYFNGEAATWADDHTGRDRTQEDYRRLVDRLGVRDGETVADLGSGTGVMIPYLLERVGENGCIIAVDIAEEMIIRLRERFPQSNVKILCGCASDLPVEKGSCDRIMCFAAFPHFTDKQKCTHEFRRILVDEGELLIAHFASREKLNNCHHEIGDFMKNDILPSGEEITGMLLNAGFSDIRVEDEDDHYYVQSVSLSKGMNKRSQLAM